MANQFLSSITLVNGSVTAVQFNPVTGPDLSMPLVLTPTTADGSPAVTVLQSDGVSDGVVIDDSGILTAQILAAANLASNVILRGNSVGGQIGLTAVSVTQLTTLAGNIGNYALLDTANTFTVGPQTIAPTSGTTASLIVKESAAGATTGAAEFHAKNESATYGPFQAFNDTYSTTVPGCYYFVRNTGHVYFGTGATKALGLFLNNAYNGPHLLVNPSGGNGFGGVLLCDGADSGTQQPRAPAEMYSNNNPTNGVLLVGAVTHNAGSGSDGIGVGFAYYCRDSTSVTQVAEIDAIWASATHATRKGRVIHYVYDTAARESFREETDGTNPMMGFLGAAAVVRQNITGVRTGTLAQLQTVVANLLTGLANLGLITDSTT